MVQAEADYHATVPAIVAAIQVAVDAHGGKSEPLTQDERDTLAKALEAEMEA